MKLLLVEDDLILSESVAEALINHGYVVDAVDNGEDAWEQAQRNDYSILLLDYNLPGVDGMSLCRRLRSQGYTTPILMMTARNTSSDKVAGLDSGADDYIVKPIDLPELLARLRALIRRNRGNTSAQWKCGDLCLDPSNHVVTFKNNVVNLTPKEFALLELFLQNQSRVLSRQAIISQLWNTNDTPTEESVKAHLKTLRNKLSRAGAEEDFIETVWGVGYRLKLL
jgi:DNA-binding response OmpR family regulator